MFLPTPEAVLGKFFVVWTEGFEGATLPEHIFASCGRVFVALAFAVFSGVAVGFAIHLSQAARGVLEPLLEFYRPIPPLAYLPLVIIWFGIGEPAKILVIYLGIFPSIVIATSDGLRSVARDKVNAARSLGASPLQVVTLVLLTACVAEHPDRDAHRPRHRMGDARRRGARGGEQRSRFHDQGRRRLSGDRRGHPRDSRHRRRCDRDGGAFAIDPAAGHAVAGPRLVPASSTSICPGTAPLRSNAPSACRVPLRLVEVANPSPERLFDSHISAALVTVPAPLTAQKRRQSLPGTGDHAKHGGRGCGQLAHRLARINSVNAEAAGARGRRFRRRTRDGHGARPSERLLNYNYSFAEAALRFPTPSKKLEA